VEPDFRLIGALSAGIDGELCSSLELDRYRPSASLVRMDRQLNPAPSRSGLRTAGAPSAAIRPTAPGVIASSATGIVSWIERLHGDIDRIFGHAGIAPEMAGSPTLVIDLKSFCRLFEESARTTRNDNFGLWFGIKFEPRDLGLWGYAALSAPTLGSALSTLVELFPLHQQSSSMRLMRDASGLMRLEYRIETPAILERRQDAELTLGQLVSFMRAALGMRWSPEEVQFEHPRPEGWRDHEEAFGAPVSFSRASNALLFNASILTIPMPTHDARLMVAMRHCLQQIAGRNDLRASVTDQVRAAVRARLAEGVPALDAIAAELRLAPGHILRELTFDGLTYMGLVECARRDLALTYLRQRQLSLSEIAFLLGYSELSAFSRAVRRWTGSSPRAVRAELFRCAAE
jgi:AraC-like DNA-binding protein